MSNSSPSRRIAVRPRLFVAFVLLSFALASLVGATKSDAASKLDPSFGTNGVVRIASIERVRPINSKIFEDGSGRLLILANRDESSDNPYCQGFYALRLLSNGDSDPTFGNEGTAEGPIICESFVEAFVLPSENIVLGGVVSQDCALLRWLHGDGDPLLGSSFVPKSGVRQYCRSNPHLASTNLHVEDVALDYRGRILISGTTWKGGGPFAGFALRILPNGKRDSTFRGNRSLNSPLTGMIEMKVPRESGPGRITNAPFTVIKVLGTGRILVAGTVRGKYFVARFRNDGRFDESFGNNGSKQFDLDGSKCRCSRLNSMTRDYQGRILLAGATDDKVAGASNRYRNSRVTLTRLLADGRTDLRFGTNGVIATKGSFDPKIAVQRNGRIVVLSRTKRGKPLLERFLPTGKPDRSFFTGGSLTTLDGYPTSLILDSQERIIVEGQSDSGGFQVTRILSR